MTLLEKFCKALLYEDKKKCRIKSMRFLIEHPWIVIVALSVLFYISVGILYYKNTKRRKAFNTIKSYETR